MPISEKMRERRRKYVGSSDIPCILGLSRFANSADIWLYKTYQIDEDPSKLGEGSPADVGTYLEEGILQWGMDQISDDVYEGKVTVTKNQFRVLKGTNHSANLDGVLSVDGSPTAVFEIKSTGNSDGWGKPMTAEIPDHVNAQVQWQMHITKLDHAWIAALCSNDFGGMTFALYTVARDQGLIDSIVDIVNCFWEDYVQAGVMPEGQAPRLQTLKNVQRTPETFEVEDEEDFDALCRKHTALQSEALAANKAVQESKALLLSRLYDKEGCRSAAYSLT